MISRAERMLQLLASDDGCNEFVCIQALWHPIQRHAPDYKGGTMMMPECLGHMFRAFCQALLLLSFARKQGRRKLHCGEIWKSVSASSLAQATEEPDEDKRDIVGTIIQRSIDLVEKTIP